MAGHGELVQRHFHDIATQYAGLFQQANDATIYPSGPARMETAVATLARHVPAGHIVDLGCGTGHTALALCERGYRVAGVDFAAGMVQSSRTLLDGSPHADCATFQVADVRETPLPAGRADGAIALGVTEWLEEDAAFGAEIARLLRPGGVAVVSFRNRLFNLFSMNDHTAAELESGEMTRLLAELRTEMARGASDASLEAAAKSLGDAARRLADAGPAPEVNALPRKPVDIRQHTPAEAAAAYATAVGLTHVETVYTHFHPFPPGFERANPRAFNFLALALESLARTPVGALMASGFLAVLRK